MNDHQLSTLFGLKYNPFLPSIPVDDLWHPPAVEVFFPRVESLARTGGFAMITGETGAGKSKALHMLAGRLDRIPELAVGVMERPQSSLGDFYREMGELFGVNLSPANRYGGFKALRARWHEHIKSTLMRPVLLIDEAQSMYTASLSELRLLGSAHFDSQCLLTTVLCGDPRLPERFRGQELMPLGNRIRTRLTLEPLDPKQLLEYLDHLLDRAGAPHLMSEQLRYTLCDHAAGNLRVLANLGAELLAAAIERQVNTIDEKLFMEVFTPAPRSRNHKAAARRDQ